jgi:dUTP pyrophosphatase
MAEKEKEPLHFYELKLFTENSALKKRYYEYAQKHNYAFHAETHPDSGFDLFNPEKELTFPAHSITKLDMEVIGVMVYHTHNNEKPIGYTVYSRSSTPLKTPLRLANNVGIIDSGYRGNLGAIFDNVSDTDFELSQSTTDRFIQICAPNLEPFLVTVVDTREELGEKTRRGSGGFGSTNK